MAASDFNTLNELFLQATEKHATPDCFLYKSGGRYCALSSREATRMVAALASVLESLGTRPGDRVALLSENRLEWALTDYAILGRRAVTVPIYPTLLDPDIEFILRDSEARGIVLATDVQLSKVLNIWKKLPALKFVLAMDCGQAAGTEAHCWESSIASELAYRSGVLLEPFRRNALAAQPGDTASILYTSGTTGQLKGVILTHGNIVSNVQAIQDLFPMGRQDVAMSFLPLCHVFERTVDFVYLWKGVSIAYAENLDALPQNLREVRPTVMAVVPRLLEKIHEKVRETVRQAPPSKQRLFARAVRLGRQCIPYQLERRTLPVGLRLKHAIADGLVFSKVREQLGGRLTSLISGAAPLSSSLCLPLVTMRRGEPER
jgi:long-chain acyl-CoA synthetase